jgi:hypothetical protein
MHRCRGLHTAPRPAPPSFVTDASWVVRVSGQHPLPPFFFFFATVSYLRIQTISRLIVANG